jgi:hypothetical protein
MSYPNGARAVIHQDLAVDRTLECKAGAVLHFNGGTPVDAADTYTETYSTAARTIPAATVAAPTAAVLTATNIAAKTPAALLTQSTGTAPTESDFNQLAMDLGTLVNSQRTQIVALTADVLALKKLIVALVQDLKAVGLIATS